MVPAHCTPLRHAGGLLLRRRRRFQMCTGPATRGTSWPPTKVMSFKMQDPMAHEDMGTAFGCMQQAIAGIGETLCLEHASLLKVRDESPTCRRCNRRSAQAHICIALRCAAVAARGWHIPDGHTSRQMQPSKPLPPCRQLCTPVPDEQQAAQSGTVSCCTLHSGLPLSCALSSRRRCRRCLL